MVGLLIAIFLGWCGGYRFYKKQILFGVVYLFTFGLFGIGWIIDIISAAKSINSPQSNSFSSIQIVQGAFAECKKNPLKRRVEIIQQLSVGDPLNLEISYYENKPFYLVVDPKSTYDIGSLPKETSRLIRSDYQNARLFAVLTKKDIDYPEIQLTIMR